MIEELEAAGLLVVMIDEETDWEALTKSLMQEDQPVAIVQPGPKGNPYLPST